MQEPGFWDDPSRSAPIVRQRRALDRRVKTLEKLHADAEELETEHGQVKEFLYRLNHMAAGDPAWIDTVREFRAAVESHARMEEEQVFPRLRSEIDEELDDRITKEVNRAGFMMS